MISRHRRRLFTPPSGQQCRIGRAFPPGVAETVQARFKSICKTVPARKTATTHVITSVMSTDVAPFGSRHVEFQRSGNGKDILVPPPTHVHADNMVGRKIWRNLHHMGQRVTGF